MSQDRLPPPPPACLLRPYPSKQKGGTVIVETVTDLAAHRDRVCRPDGYRPRACPRCAGDRLHVHDYRVRVLRAEPSGVPTLVVVRYRCVACRAVWLVLPRFLARRLWRSWPVVEAVTLGPPPALAAPQVPARTVQRWHSRLAAAAQRLGEVLREAAETVLGEVAAFIGPATTRLAAVLAYAAARGLSAGERLAQLAAVVHRLSPGVRLM